MSILQNDRFWVLQRIKSVRNPFVLFLPFLFLYIVFVLVMYSIPNRGDEPRYFRYANNILNHLLLKPAQSLDLTNGPGYPILMLPFVALHLPKICIILMNAVFHYLSIVFLFKALQQFLTFKKTLAFSIFWGCYYIAYQQMFSATTETTTMFLMSLLIFFLTKAYLKKSIKNTKKYIFLSGFTLGYIVLIKVIFGYVVLTLLGSLFLLWCFNRKKINYRKGLLVLSISFLTFVPYLAYTYYLTGKIFYFGAASDTLYWMSSPYQGEFGDWKGSLDLNAVEFGNYNIPGSDDSLVAHHKRDFDEVYQLKDGIEQGEMFQKIAIRNIKAHPLKYGQNIFYNIGRIFFHYPFSYAVQRPKTLFVLPINGILVTFILICLIPTLMFWRRIFFPLRLLLFVALLYLGASSLVSAETRMLTIVVPILIFWFGYIIQKTIKIEIGKEWNYGNKVQDKTSHKSQL